MLQPFMYSLYSLATVAKVPFHDAPQLRINARACRPQTSCMSRTQHLSHALLVHSAGGVHAGHVLHSTALPVIAHALRVHEQ